MKEKIEKILREVWEDNMSFESDGSEETIKNAINQLSTLIQESNREAVEGFAKHLIEEYGSGKYTDDNTWIETTVKSLNSDVQTYLSSIGKDEE